MGNSLINLGELSKPANTLVEKISEALGGIFRPHQIVRVAKAEAQADMIRAEAQIEISELQRRALNRFVAEETRKQDNIEQITSKAIPLLKDSAKPQEMDNDWIAYFFDKCKYISDEEMQTLWAKILSGEANKPGSFSKRAINIIGIIEKSEANDFTTLCGYCWFLYYYMPLIYDLEDQIYTKNKISFDMLKNLENIGLVNLSAFYIKKGGGYAEDIYEEEILLHYFDNSIIVRYDESLHDSLRRDSYTIEPHWLHDNLVFNMGCIMLTSAGRQLASACGSRPVEGFMEYIIKGWLAEGLILSSPYPR